MKKTVVLLMILTIVSKVIGFARDMTLSYFYGASTISDVFLISLIIPTVIFSFIGTGVSIGYIPTYSMIENDHGSKEGLRFTNNLINILLIFSTIIAILGLVFTNQLVNAFALGFEGSSFRLAVQFTRISLIGVYFTGCVYIFVSFLQVKGKYAVTALVGFPLNFVLMIFIMISSKTNIYILPIGNVIAIASQILFLVPYLAKNGYRYSFTFDLRDKHILNMLKMCVPVILGVSVNQINILVDRTIASQIVAGGISALAYANRLNMFVQAIAVGAISTYMFPQISKMAAVNDIPGLKKSVAGSITAINLLVIPATIGLSVFSRPIISLLFGRGAFDSQAISMTASALFYYSIGMIGFGLREVLSRAFYSMQDTKTPMKNAAIGIVINIILNLILSKYMGIGGLAFATSIAAIVTTGMMFISLRRKIGPLGMKKVFISFLKILVASMIMGFIAEQSFYYLTGNIFSQDVSVILAIGIGVVAYFIAMYFMNIEDVDNVVNAIKGNLRRWLPNGNGNKLGDIDNTKRRCS